MAHPLARAVLCAAWLVLPAAAHAQSPGTPARDIPSDVPTLDDVDAQRAYRAADLDQDGTISFEEFRTALSTCLPAEGGGPDGAAPGGATENHTLDLTHPQDGSGGNS